MRFRVQAPVSLAEWFLNFYPAARAGAVKPLEGVCGPGDLIYVPHGWWRPPPPPSRTTWTRRVPHPVLIAHAASLTPY